MFKEFKAFAMRGNVLDMAVGIIIGAAFGQIVNSFVQDVLMPPIGRLLGHVSLLLPTRHGFISALRCRSMNPGVLVVKAKDHGNASSDEMIIASKTLHAVSGWLS